MNEPNISALIGLTMASVEGKVGGDEIVFVATDGRRFKLYHRQDCCESVYVADICGDLSDLVGVPILKAEEVSSEGEPPLHESDATDGSYTWTFYKFATIKGYVDVRFYGSSNGYYSESVDFAEVTQ